MSTPAIPATPHVSFLKKFGQEVLKIVTFGIVRVEPAVKIGATVAEGILPQYAGVIAAGEGLFERGLTLAQNIEADFAAANKGSNGPAKFSVLSGQLGSDLDQVVQAKIPGLSADALKAESYVAAKTGVLNSIVALLNSIDGNSVTVNPTPAQVSSSAAVAAALKA